MDHVPLFGSTGSSFGRLLLRLGKRELGSGERGVHLSTANMAILEVLFLFHLAISLPPFQNKSISGF